MTLLKLVLVLNVLLGYYVVWSAGTQLQRGDLFKLHAGHQCWGESMPSNLPSGASISHTVEDCAVTCVSLGANCAGVTYRHSTEACEEFVSGNNITLVPQSDDVMCVIKSTTFFQIGAIPTVVMPTVGLPNYKCSDASNPCVAPGRPAIEEYYADADPVKYIQCGSDHSCYEKACQSPLVWNQAAQACDWA